MKITKVKVGYSTSIPIAAYGIKDNAWAEVEVELKEGDSFDFDSLFTSLKEDVDATVKEKYPHLYGLQISVNPEAIQHIAEQSKPQPEERRIGDLAGDIRSCTDLRVLETYRFLIKNKPELQAVYDEVHGKLSGLINPNRTTNQSYK